MSWVTLDEVSRTLGFDSPDPLRRLFSFFPGAFPGAERSAKHGWIIPSTTLSALKRERVGIELVQEATVQEVAESIRRSVSTVHRWCQPGPHGEPPLLKSRKVAGTVLIDVRSVLALPAKLPDWLTESVKQNRGINAGAAPEMVLSEGKVSELPGLGSGLADEPENVSQGMCDTRQIDPNPCK
jgi:hypothetical protein